MMSNIPFNATASQLGSSAKDGKDNTEPATMLDKLRSVNIEMGPGLRDVQAFTTQLAVMLKAGINIRDAIDGVASQVQNKKFKNILEQICSDVESGIPFSEALDKYPKVFKPLYVNMIKASELSGGLASMLDRLAKFLDSQIETRTMVISAMVYPIIIGVMAIVTVIFMLTFVLPRFTALFAGKEDLLPAPTVMLLAISDFLQNQWYLAIGSVVAIGVGIKLLLNTEKGGNVWDRFKLRMPLMGKMFRALYISQSMNTMAELLSAGVGMLQTLEITADIAGNSVYRNMWLDVRNAVKQGDRLTTPLLEKDILPRNVIQMISAGENSGKLGEVMQDVAAFYARELKGAIKVVTSMIEPIMIVVMGMIVGFIAMSIILPIFKMSSVVK